MKPRTFPIQFRHSFENRSNLFLMQELRKYTHTLCICIENFTRNTGEFATSDSTVLRKSLFFCCFCPWTKSRKVSTILTKCYLQRLPHVTCIEIYEFKTKVLVCSSSLCSNCTNLLKSELQRSVNIKLKQRSWFFTVIAALGVS